MTPLENVEKSYFPDRRVCASHSVYHMSLSGTSGATKCEEILTLQTYNVNADHLECHLTSPLIWLGHILGK